MVQTNLAESRQKAQALIMQGSVYDPSGRILKPGTLLDPDHKLAVKAQFFLGKIYEERKNYPEALKNYKTALEKYPNESYAQWAGWRLGWVHYLDGKFEDAFNKFQEAVEPLNLD